MVVLVRESEPSYLLQYCGARVQAPNAAFLCRSHTHTLTHTHTHSHTHTHQFGLCVWHLLYLEEPVNCTVATFVMATVMCAKACNWFTRMFQQGGLDA